MGYKDDLVIRIVLPSIDAFMRHIKDEVDASWFTSDPDAENKRIHERLRAQADWMLVNVPQLPHLYEELLSSNDMIGESQDHI